MSSNASPATSSVSESSQVSVSEKLRQNLAYQDWIALCYHTYLYSLIMLAPDSSMAISARQGQGGLLLVTVVTIFLVRSEILPAGWFRALLYRVGMFASIAGSYFVLAELLPSLQPVLLDQELMQLDIILFGATPSVWMAQFNTFPVVEWLSFFYWSYFFILGLMTIPWMMLARGKMLVELMLGASIVCSLGHIGYTLVPGLGPFETLEFAEPLNGGLFLGLVLDTVASTGAALDIFPSLHTAYPTFFALWAFSNRKHRVVKWVWPVLAFFAVNIVVSTMFLRWHWAIDVMAGLGLAFFAWRFGQFASRFEMKKGTGSDRRQPVWEPLGLGEWFSR